MTQTPLNRRGRKRKSGRRTLSGALARKPVDYRAMAARQPHRIRLPEALRTDEKAESVLGCLNLINRISKRTEGNRPGITNEQYEAGRRYSVLVGAYLSMIGIGTGGGGRGAHDCETGACDICRATTQRYMRAHEAVPTRKAHMAINHVVIDDRLCDAEELEHLRAGLSALARHFGLGRER
jgi:hypothetical protein